MVKVQECVIRIEFATAAHYESQQHITLDLTLQSLRESPNWSSSVYKCTTTYHITWYWFEYVKLNPEKIRGDSDHGMS